MKKNSKRYTNELGSMPLALMVTVLIISLSGIALSILAFQSKTQTIRTSKWENSTAMMSGMAFAAEQVGSQAAPKTAAQCQLMFPSRPPKPNEAGYLESWRKNTDTSTAADTDINTGQRRELGLFRWWVDCDQQLLSAGKIVARVEVSNVAYSTRTDPIPLKQSLISSESWNNYPLGNITSSVTGPPGTTFNRNSGVLGENVMASGTSPYGGVNERVWRAVASGDSDADGGWNTATVAIDKTKMYRTSVWVKRPAGSLQTNSGRFYLGPRGNGGLLQRSNNVLNTNPYSVVSGPSGQPALANEWYLLVGHIWPAGSGAGANMPGTGMWKRSGEKIAVGQNGLGGVGDFVWQDTNTTVHQSVYLFYSSVVGTTQEMFDPRLEVVDGTEPSIDDLLRGPPVSLPILDAQKVVFENGQYAYSTSTTPSDKE